MIRNQKKSLSRYLRKKRKLLAGKQKTSSKKNLSNIIYDILTDNRFPDDKANEITAKIIDLAERNI